MTKKTDLATDQALLGLQFQTALCFYIVEQCEQNPNFIEDLPVSEQEGFREMYERAQVTVKLNKKPPEAIMQQMRQLVTAHAQNKGI